MMIVFYVMIAIFGIGILWWLVDAVGGLAEVEREFFADYFFKRVLPPLAVTVLLVWALFSVGGVF